MFDGENSPQRIDKLKKSEAIPSIVPQMSRTDLLAFFLAGLFNNSSYVIMIAGAKNISPSMVGLVYVCLIVPR